MPQGTCRPAPSCIPISRSPRRPSLRANDCAMTAAAHPGSSRARDARSLLFTLFYIASSGDEKNPGTFERNFNTRNGAQMWRLEGGSALIAKKVVVGKRLSECAGPFVKSIRALESELRSSPITAAF